MRDWSSVSGLGESGNEGYMSDRIEALEAEVKRLNEGWSEANDALLAERLANIGKVHPCDDQTAGNLVTALAEIERLTALNRVSTENHRGLWVALRMVRDAIEEVGPAGILPNIEHEGVEPEQIAEHFVAAISRIAALAGEGDEPAPQGSVEDITQAIAGRNK